MQLDTLRHVCTRGQQAIRRFALIRNTSKVDRAISNNAQRWGRIRVINLKITRIKGMGPSKAGRHNAQAQRNEQCAQYCDK
jgi:hypothetical protein